MSSDDHVAVSADDTVAVSSDDAVAVSSDDNVAESSDHNVAVSSDDTGFKAALAEAKQGFEEGGIPIGACLAAADGTVLGRGHNMRVRQNSAILHGEMCALENAGRLPASAYRGSTMYTTLSPCNVCAGACILSKVSRVVMGENNTFAGGEDLLRQHGIEVVSLRNAECEQLMQDFIAKHPQDWCEDIGEDK